MDFALANLAAIGLACDVLTALNVLAALMTFKEPDTGCTIVGRHYFICDAGPPKTGCIHAGSHYFVCDAGSMQGHSETAWAGMGDVLQGYEDWTNIYPYRCVDKSGNSVGSSTDFTTYMEKESLWHEVFDMVYTWALSDPITVVKLLVCIASAIFADPPILSALCSEGSCRAGIAAGSITAATHSTIGNVEAGSAFACLQSPDAAGQCLSVLSNVLIGHVCGAAANSLIGILRQDLGWKTIG